MRFRLRTLLIVLALGPPVVAGGWWAYNKLRPETEQERMQRFWALMEEEEAYWKAQGLDYPPEPLIGYPFGPNDPRWPNGYAPNRPLKKVPSD
jgi:hypothetical protein